MTDERWKEIIGTIKDNFEIIDHRTLELPEEDGEGTVEVVEFNGPLGRIKLQRTTQPLIIDRKSLGSKRIGSDQVIQYTYSDTEKVNKFTAYKFDDVKDDWVEMEMEKGSMLF